MFDNISKDEIVEEFLGVPFKHGGRGKDGLDCYGLIIKIYEKAGYRLFDVANYAVNWSAEKNLFIENYHMQWQRVENPGLFDVVLFRSKNNIPDHVGVYIGAGKFIHTCKAGTVITRLNGEWKGKIEGFYRIKDVN